MSIGNTGLSGHSAGWQLLAAQDVPGGMANAKAYPPKDVIVVQDGLQGVTLDTLVFGLKNDPRTQDVPLIIVTDNVGNVESLYGDQAAAVVGSASWDSVNGVAGEATEAMARAMATAQLAAAVLSSLPASRVQAAAQSTAEALASGADDATKIVLLNLAGGAGLIACLPAAEGVVLNGGNDDLMIAALNACARLWSVTGPAGDRNALAGALQNALTSGNADLAYSAAEALGQLGGSAALVVAGGN
jgi:hypothetical protein